MALEIFSGKNLIFKSSTFFNANNLDIGGFLLEKECYIFSYARARRHMLAPLFLYCYCTASLRKAALSGRGFLFGAASAASPLQSEP
jgi:hypothetical protein